MMGKMEDGEGLLEPLDGMKRGDLALGVSAAQHSIGIEIGSSISQYGFL